MVRTCPHCGCSEIDEDAARGDATCTGCGTVLEESIVVSENQFQERAGGSGHTLVGQFVSMERSQTHTLQGVPGLPSQESREVTFQKGKKLIEEIASQLRINTHCIDTAYNFFKMSVCRNLTRGRIRSHVVAACMYMTCRLENTAHLLLDFSDVTQVNVFDLGRTLSFLSRSLRINLPTTDPCMYIMRFACMLEFGEKQKDVVNLATRLVQRMKRDWMATGRRPTGLCGAALLIAARALNFNRSISDVVRVVHISESVVRKRLEEFSQTPSGALTIDEFSTVDLEHSEDPPAFREARRKAREEQLLKEEELLDHIENEIEPLGEELEVALEKKRREKFKRTPYAKLVAGGLDDPEVGNAEAALVRGEIIDSVYNCADDIDAPSTSKTFSDYRPSLQSLGISNGSKTPLPSKAVPPQDDAPLPPMDRPDGELNLDDIDDDEIDSYILTQSESVIKERFWMKCNGEHVKEMERRKREREEQEEKAKDNPNPKKRRKSTHHARTMNGQAATAVEAMEKIIHEKKLSNKVNYDILKEIEQTSVTAPTRRTLDPAEALQDVKKVIKEIEGTSSTTEAKCSSLLTPDLDDISSDALSRREKELQRKNVRTSSSTNLSTLRTTFKVPSTTPEGGVTSSPAADKKPVLPLRNRFGRARPNLSVSRTKEKPSVIDSVDQPVSNTEVETPPCPAKPDAGHNEVISPVDVLPSPSTAAPVEDSPASDSLSMVNPKTELRVTIEKPTVEEKVKEKLQVPAKMSRLSRGRKPAPLIGKVLNAKPEQKDAELIGQPADEPPKPSNTLLKRGKAKANIPEELLRRSSRR